jgi:DNA-binding NarL/FixJ family response regulator
MYNVLVVEPDPCFAAKIRQSIQTVTRIVSEKQFGTAKKRLADNTYDFVITNLRLAEYNGIHLVYLAATTHQPPRCIVYTDQRDAWLAGEIQRAGAFYEMRECLPVTLTAYLTGTLPDVDRRDAATPDRRAALRGGRRCWDPYRQSAPA